MRQRAGAAPTPLAAARRVLAAIGPTTAVSVQRNVMVAGRAAYQLAVAPKSSSSTIGRVTIAVDAAGHFPLRVQVFARGGTSPAFQIGFTALTLGKPAASNFTFTPPSGAKVKTVKVPAGGPLALSGMALPGMMLPGAFWSGAAPGRCLMPPPGVLRGLHKRIQFKIAIRRALPHGATSKRVEVLRPGTLRRVLIRRGAVPCGALSAKALKDAKAAAKSGGLVSRQGPRGSLYAIPSKNWVSYQPMTGGGNSMLTAAPVAAPRPTVMGKGWLSVLVIRPSGPPVATATIGGRKVAVRDTGLGGQQVIINPKNGKSVSPPGLAGLPPYLRTLVNAGAAVHGAWGRGRLIRTTLFSALITSNGTVLIGAVTPAVLYADAAAAK